MALVKIEEVKAVAGINASRVENRTDADLAVYVTDSHGVSFGKEDVWSFVENEGEANIRLFWDDVTKTSEIKICFVDTLSAAGWINEHPLKGKLKT